MKKLVLLPVLLTACGTSAPPNVTRTPGDAIPVTYYPTPTSVTMLQARASTPTQPPVVEVTQVPPTPTQPLASPTQLPTATPQPPADSPVAPTATAQPTSPAQSEASAASSCPTTSNATFDVIPIDGGFYKNNAITDENADFRLSIIGYIPSDAQLGLIDLPGSSDPGAPKLQGMFEPNRVPQITRTYKRYDWNWNESAPPPYGTRGGINNDDQAPVAVVDFATSPGEKIHIPERDARIYGDNVAMVLYASPQELTVVYHRHDTVGEGYMVHMMNFCVDPNLVAAYVAQLDNGKRKTGALPAVRKNQPLGVAVGSLTVAIRDRARFLDPRSRKDWWQGAP